MAAQLVPQFENLGLTANHALIYEALIELGRATLKQIAEKTQIPRSSCYEHVPHLIRLGLASEIIEGKTRFIVPENPTKIQSLLSDKKLEIEDDLIGLDGVIGDLISQYNSIQERPSVKFLKGEEGIKTILKETLEQEEEILVLCQGDESDEHLEDEPEYFKKYFYEFKKRKCKSREIIEERGDAKEYKEKYEDENQQILLAPPITKLKTVHIDKIIYANKVAIIEFEKELVIVIEDQMIAQNERLTFNVLWNALVAKGYKYSVNPTL